VYEVRLFVPRDSFRKAQHTVRRRYSEFFALHQAVARGWGKQITSSLKLPPKKWFTLSESARETRRLKLEAYVQQLTCSLNWALHPEVRAFFEVDVWAQPRKVKS